MGSRDVYGMGGTRLCHSVGVANGHPFVSSIGKRLDDDLYPSSRVRIIPVPLVEPIEGALIDFIPDAVAQGTATSTQEHRFPT